METFFVTALKPHGNVLSLLEAEHRQLCGIASFTPFFPLFCPLAISADRATIESSIGHFKDFFQTRGTKALSIEKTLIKQDFIYRPLKPFEFLENTLEQKKIGPFLIEAGTFLFGYRNFQEKKKESCASKGESVRFFCENQEPLKVSVFRLSVLRIVTGKVKKSENTDLYWEEFGETWIKLR